MPRRDAAPAKIKAGAILFIWVAYPDGWRRRPHRRYLRLAYYS